MGVFFGSPGRGRGMTEKRGRGMTRKGEPCLSYEAESVGGGGQENGAESSRWGRRGKRGAGFSEVIIFLCKMKRTHYPIFPQDQSYQ